MTGTSMKNKISLIAACSLNQVIGINNQLPWSLPSDLKKFRELTLNKPIVMGRKTLESIGRILPKRRNIVLTRNQDFKFPGAEIFNNFQDVLNLQNPDNLEIIEIMVIGGAEIYEIFLPYASKIYLTEVNVNLNGDAFFPAFKSSDWCLTHSEFHDKTLPENKDNQYDYEFKILKKL